MKTCKLCGFTWKDGEHGSHACWEEKDARTAELEAEVKHMDSMRHAEEMKYIKAQKQLLALRDAAQNKLDTETDCWAANQDSVLFAAQARNIKAHDTLAALVQEKADG